jgi:hypothetical protein
MVIDEAHSLLAYLEVSKTTEYLWNIVWWKEMISDIKLFCETCHRSKPSNQKPYGLLNLLPVPTHPWKSIGLDFVGPLPKSSNFNVSYDRITIMICLLTCNIISNQGVLSTSIFWQRLHALLGTKLKCVVSISSADRWCN